MKIHKLISVLTVLTIAAGAAGCSSEGAGSGGSDFTAAPTSPSASAETKGERADTAPPADAETNAADFAAEGTDDAAIMTDGIMEAESAKSKSQQQTYSVEPQAGLLTAGEWNDNDNWGFFSNLVNSQTIVYPSFGLEPRFRTMVTVQAQDGTPIVNAKARLLDSDGKILWSGVTNKQGIVYLFADNDGQAASVEVESSGTKENFVIESAKTDGQSQKKTESNELTVTFGGESKTYKPTEVMFILDTTGSMSDEMLFLQSEFTAITKEIGTQDTKYSVNFYRDEGDDYVTKCFGFTDDINDLQSKLNAESADGGGDVPEAVAEILKKTMTESNWSDESVKIAFLIFDAPPHDGTEETIISAVKQASEKGIRIIPVVSSNSERDTELFARSLAITTGGTYIFLTDDSGIGDSHLEPIIGDYEVEKLYDIIIRVINDYRQ